MASERGGRGEGGDGERGPERVFRPWLLMPTVNKLIPWAVRRERDSMSDFLILLSSCSNLDEKEASERSKDKRRARIRECYLHIYLRHIIAEDSRATYTHY